MPTYYHLGTVTSSGSTATLTFSGINTTTYKNFRVVALTKSASTNADLRWRANGITNNYCWQGFYQGSSTSTMRGEGATATICALVGPSTQSAFSFALIEFIGSSNAVISMSNWNYQDGTYNYMGQFLSSYTTGNTALSSLSFILDNGANFANGTTIKLYGLG